MNPRLTALLKGVAQSAQRITVLTGAGVSAESGIPTFRGPEGFWTIGSSQYHPQEMATYRMFCRKPDEVWKWYLYRLGICAKAGPNQGHLALAEMERRFNDRFTLITQNVDGLHLRAGNSQERTYQIHGNIAYMRCARECRTAVYPMPASVNAKAKGEDLTDEDRKALNCPDCGGRSRPHVLWFDETYNETYYRYQSSLHAAGKTDLLLIAGTSGSTNLPNQVAWEVHRHGGIIVDINLEPNPFSNLALSGSQGFFMQEPSSAALPWILRVLSEAAGS